MPTPTDFTNFQFQEQQQDYEQSSREERDGSYGQGAGPLNLTYAGTEIVPSSTRSKQFSSGDNGDPGALASASMDSDSKFAELQEFLNNNLETAGSRIAHPRQKRWVPPAGAEGE
jgi:hypothetical protein